MRILEGPRPRRIDRRRILVPERLEPRALMTFGLPDQTFGTGGAAVVALNDVNPPPFKTRVVGEYVQPDGKILVVISGYQQTTLAAGGSTAFPVLERLNPDGSPDTSFGSGGQISETPAAGFPDNFAVTASAMQGDGKILLVGSSGRRVVGLGPVRLAVERVNPDGSLDKTFNFNGPSVGFSDGSGSAIAAAPGGKVVVATTATVPPQMWGYQLAPAFLRLNADGSPDSTFGANHDGQSVLAQFAGPVFVPFPSLLAMQGDEVVAADTVSNPFVIRLDAHGSMDSGFGTGGVASFNPFDITPDALAIDAAGRILLAGSNNFNRITQQGELTQFALGRLTNSGQPDASFGAGNLQGIVTIPFDSRASNVRSIGFESGGRILASGVVAAADNRSQLAMARINENGTLDTSFGPGGTVITPTEIFDTSLLTLDPQDRVLEARVGSSDQFKPLLVAHRFLTTDVTPPDLTPPSVKSFTTTVRKHRFTSLHLTFSEAMVASTAGKSRSYRLVSAGRDGKLGTRDDRTIKLRSAKYDQANHSVALTPACKLPMKTLYQLTGLANDLTDLAGNLLAGQGNDIPGRNYVTTFGGVPTKS